MKTDKGQFDEVLSRILHSPPKKEADLKLKKSASSKDSADKKKESS